MYAVASLKRLHNKCNPYQKLCDNSNIKEEAEGFLFYISVLEMDTYAVIKVPDQLAADEEFRAYVEENIDLAYVAPGVPQENLPQWIMNWES